MAIKPVYQLPLSESGTRATKQAHDAEVNRVLSELYALTLGGSSQIAQDAAAAAAESANEAELTLAEVLAFTDTQMRSVSEFSSQAAFEAYRNSFDYWRSGSLVSVGDMTFQKRLSDVGLLWVRVDEEADALLDGYLEDVAGVIQPRHLASIPPLSVMFNPLVRQGRPLGIPYQNFLYLVGQRWYGDTASGGINVPRSGVLPNAANAMRSGRGTTVAGETTVTFHTPFAPCIPNVIVMAKATSVADARLTVNLIGDPEPDHFKCVITDASGTPVVRGFDYFATGNGDY